MAVPASAFDKREAADAMRILKRLRPPRARSKRLGRLVYTLHPIEWLARAGYAARGLVYLLIGALAFAAAFELRAAAPGSRDALTFFADWPFGLLWLGTVGVGLGGFAVWRVVQALFDADRQGRSAKALAQRGGQLLSAAIYGTLAMSVLELADDLEEGGEREEAEQAVSVVLSLPYGEALLIAVGLFVIGAGVGNLLHGARGNFRRFLGCTDGTARWAVPVARTGYFVRGAVFVLLGIFLAEAALDLRARSQTDLGGALQSLEAQPFGSWLLAAAALGLMAFGAFGLVEARFRRIEVPDPLKPS